MKRNYQIIIEPYEIGSFKKQHYKQIFLQRLKEQHEGKCMPYGFVYSIDKILSHSIGEVYDCDLSGKVVYNVVAEVNVKNYEINDIVKIKLDSKNEGIGSYIGIDVPFLFFVFNKSDENIDISEPVKVIIKGKRIISEDNIIHIVAETIKEN
jgi:hypothetical protein